MNNIHPSNANQPLSNSQSQNKPVYKQQVTINGQKYGITTRESLDSSKTEKIEKFLTEMFHEKNELQSQEKLLISKGDYGKVYNYKILDKNKHQNKSGRVAVELKDHSNLPSVFGVVKLESNKIEKHSFLNTLSSKLLSSVKTLTTKITAGIYKLTYKPTADQKMFNQFLDDLDKNYDLPKGMTKQDVLLKILNGASVKILDGGVLKKNWEKKLREFTFGDGSILFKSSFNMNCRLMTSMEGYSQIQLIPEGKKIVALPKIGNHTLYYAKKNEGASGSSEEEIVLNPKSKNK